MIDDRTLDRVEIFRDLGSNARRELAARAVLRSFAEGEKLWRRGEEARGLFIVLEGEVRVVRSSGTRQHVLHTQGPQGTLGNIPFFEGGVYPVTAIATRPTECLVLGRDAIHAAVQQDPELAFAFLGNLSTRVRHLVERLDEHVQMSVRGRLARYLLRRHEEMGSNVITLGATQAEVAEELGTVREVVARTLKELRDEGVIEAAGRGRSRIVDEEALCAIAECLDLPDHQSSSPLIPHPPIESRR